MADRTIANPTADHLEPGGTISGTYRKLPFTDETLYDDNGVLFIADGVPIRHVNGNLGRHVTVTSYTPPEPAPWWDTCPDGAMIAWLGLHGRHMITTAREFRIVWSPHARHGGQPRRVHVSDYDTTVPVPRDALDRLRDCVKYDIPSLFAARDLVSAVYETGGEK